MTEPGTTDTVTPTFSSAPSSRMDSVLLQGSVTCSKWLVFPFHMTWAAPVPPTWKTTSCGAPFFPDDDERPEPPFAEALGEASPALAGASSFFSPSHPLSSAAAVSRPMVRVAVLRMRVLPRVELIVTGAVGDRRSCRRAEGAPPDGRRRTALRRSDARQRLDHRAVLGHDEGPGCMPGPFDQ
ncbi:MULTISPECIES: hypothetical protein [unclassified Streptomyces]|uniref:hypothetical protein n=1 Tax=unclassified Streptomyces TaxID=2593676 RepID=UPI0038200B94